VSPLCAQKLARLQTIVAERAAWADQLAQVKRLHSWLLEVEHLLDESLVPEGEEVSNGTVGSRLDSWRERMATQLTDGSLSELERECLTEFLHVLSNLRPHLVQCYDREDFPRTNNDMERSIRGRKHAVSPRQWSQELERLSVALRPLCGLRGLVGARYGPSKASGTARRPA
jgi:hypothetical protein